MKEVEHALRIMSATIEGTAACITSGNVTERQKIVAELVPGLANIGLAMKTLLNARLLSPTEVLLRAFLDRVGTLAYLRSKGDEGVRVWREGWPERKRPSFAAKLEMLPEEIFAHEDSDDPTRRFSTERLKVEIKNLKRSLHGSVHGGPESIANTFVRKDGDFDLHVIGPDLDNKQYFEVLCSIVTISIMLFVFELESALSGHNGYIPK